MFVVPNGYVCCVQDVNGCGEEDLREITVRLRRGKGEGGGQCILPCIDRQAMSFGWPQIVVMLSAKKDYTGEPGPLTAARHCRPKRPRPSSAAAEVCTERSD